MLNLPLRLGVVAYLNMQPLVYGLDALASEGLALRHAPPSQLAAWLERGEVDMAMAPAAALLAHPEWRVAPGAMIGMRGAVQSVVVAGGGAPNTWRRLRPDSHSLTSNALARIILTKMMGLDLELGEPLPMTGWEPPVTPNEGEAFVLIGSRALRWRGLLFGGGPYQAIDLGQAWRAWTGLPFICAVWAVRPGYDPGEWPARLDRIWRENMTRLPAIAARWGDLAFDRLNADEARRYLADNIDYDLDLSARLGLERYHQEGRALGLFHPEWRWRTV